MNNQIWPQFPKLEKRTNDSELQRKIDISLHLQRIVARHMIFESFESDDNIFDSYNQMIDQIIYYSNYISTVIHLRQINLVKYAYTNNYNIISLGLDCLPRSISAKYGLITSKKMGRMTCPFDLAVHGLPGMLAAIKNGFKDYGKAKNMTFNKNGYIQDKTYYATFNHDSKYIKTENGFEVLSQKVAKRIESFEEYVLCPTQKRKIFFVHLPFSKNPLDISSIYKTIKNRYSISNYIIYALSTLHSNSRKKIHSDMGCWSAIPFPSSNYIWHNALSYATDEGVSFELAILDDLYEILDIDL